MGITTHIFAQEDSWYLDKEIEEIRILGLETIDFQELKPILDEYIGIPFTEEAFFALQSKLYALDFFLEIIPSAEEFEGSRESVLLTFTVKERPVITNITVEGNIRLSRQEILNAMKIKVGDFLTITQLREDEQLVSQLLKSKGFLNSTVSIESEETDVIILISEGREFVVDKILIYGTEKIATNRILNVMETRERGFFSAGTYRERVFEADKQKIVNFYRSEGYIDAKIVDTVVTEALEEETQRTLLTLNIYLEEGSQFRFGSIEFEGNVIFSEDELSAFISLEEGDVLNEIALTSDVNLLVDAYKSNGYVFSEIDPQSRREGQYVLYRIRINERKRAHVSNIVLIGNEKTDDTVIFREITQDIGAVFSTRELRQTYYNLANLKYFSNIDVRTPVGEAEGLVDIVITVEEKNTISLQGGIGYTLNSPFPLSLTLGISDINFLGLGYQASINTKLSSQSQILTTSFSTAYIDSFPITVGVSVSFNHRSINTTAQDQVPPYLGEFPDPFTGEYVFSEDTALNGIAYSAGDKFPTVPSDQDISTYDLVTDYQHAKDLRKVSSSLTDMNYGLYTLSFSPSIAYALRTPIGLLVPRVSYGLFLEWIYYDVTQDRPYNPQLREALGKTGVVNNITLSLELDNRDIRYNPSSGYYIKQSYRLTGGILQGDRSFITLTTRGDYYHTVFDLPVTDSWSWKGVLAVQSTFDVILPTLYYPNGGNEETEGALSRELLSLNGIYNARGWPSSGDGYVRWNSFLELRMPIVETLLDFTTFFEVAGLWESREDFTKIKWSDMQFTIGAGIRLLTPQLPFRFYIGKRFSIDETDGLVWETGNINPGKIEGRGVDYIFSIDADFF